MKTQKNNLSALILCGGKGTRMGSVGLFVPKVCLLAFDQPLILRQIKQAFSAGIDNIILSTNETSFSFIKKLLQTELNAKNLKRINLIRNPWHDHSSMKGLLFALNLLETDRIIISFGDIYFKVNPFLGIKRFTYSSKSFIGGVIPKQKNELLKGGVIDANQSGRVLRISLGALIKFNKGYRWNGLVIMSKNVHKPLIAKFVRTAKADIPEEDYYDYYRKVTQDFEVFESSDFINVNNPDDLLLASSLRLKEIGNKNIPYIFKNKEN